MGRDFLRTMKTHLLYIALTLALSASCGGKSEEAVRREAQMADSAALKIATLPTIDCLPLYLVEQLRMDEETGLDLRLVPFMAQMDQDTALLRGRVEGLFTDLIRLHRMEQVEGKAMKQLCSTALSWRLVTSKTARIKELKQLDDKMVAMTRHSATDVLTWQVVDSARLQQERVYRIQVNDVKIRFDMLMSTNVDAMWLPEPWATAAVEAGHRAIYDAGKKAWKPGVLAVADSVMADSTRRKQVELLTQLYNRAVDSIAKNGWKHYADLVSLYCGVDEKVVEKMPLKQPFTHATPPTEADNAVREKTTTSTSEDTP